MMKNKACIAAVAAGLIAAVAVVGLSAANAKTDTSASALDKGNLKGPTCLDAHDTGRMHVVDDHTLLVYDSRQNAYKLDVSGPCRSMTDMSRFGFEFFGSDKICRAHDAKLLYSQNGERPLTCLINGVTPLTRNEAKVLDPD